MRDEHEVGASPVRKRGAAARRRRLRQPASQQVLEVVFALAREASLDVGKEELCGRFMRAFCELFPGRAICLRVVDPQSLELSELFAEGELQSGAADVPLGMKRSALAKTKLAARIAHSPRVRLCADYEPLFVGTATGVSIPLVASGDLLGMLNVEYPAGADASEADEPVLIPLANQFASALRNFRLLDETRWLRDYLAKLVEHANALIFAADREGRITVFNHALARLTGFSPGEVVGLNLREWLARHGARELRILVDDALAGRERTGAEVAIPSATGEAARATFSTTAIMAGSGQVDTIVGIGHDQTELEALQHQVIQAEKLATLGQLAAGVVHELNNPLTSIIVYADYLAKKLEREGHDPQDVGKLQKILEGSERILRVSRDLVAYARPAGERYDRICINEVLDQSLSFCEHIIKKGRARVVRELQSELPAVYGIKGQLQQVFINLLTNASHAMKPEGGVIAVRTKHGGGTVRIEIEDDGVGIAADDQARVYEPFFTTKLEGKGTGLGLSIVKNIIEKHEGEIHFVSNPGCGTCFHITLPCDEPSS